MEKLIIEAKKDNGNGISAHSTRKWWLWLAIGVIFFIFLFLIRDILLPFVVGGMLAYFLDPAADKLERSMPRAWASALIIGAFFMMFLLGLFLLVPITYEQLSGLLQEIPHYINSLRAQYGRQFDILVGHLVANGTDPETTGTINTNELINKVSSGDVVGFAGNLAGGLLKSGATILNLLSLLLITPVVGFYLLRDWDMIVERIDALLPVEHRETIRLQVNKIDAVLNGFIRGQTLVILMLGAFYAIGLSIVGLKFGILVGLLTGLLTIIPYAGVLFGMVLGAGIALFQFHDWVHVGIVLGIFALGQFIEGNFVTPKLMGERVGLHPAWIIFGMLAGGALFGFVGILLAVPITAVIGVLVRFAIEKYRESSLYRSSQIPLVTTSDGHPPGA